MTAQRLTYKHCCLEGITDQHPYRYAGNACEGCPRVAAVRDHDDCPGVSWHPPACDAYLFNGCPHPHLCNANGSCRGEPIR